MKAALGRAVPPRTGRNIYRLLADRLGSAEAASRWLNEQGVKGLRYLDQGSRGHGEGTYNFVVFDDQAIDVIETYYQGQPAPGRASARARPATSSAPTAATSPWRAGPTP